MADTLDLRPQPPELINSATGGLYVLGERFDVSGQPFDPFLGSPIQTNRLKAWCQIIYNGVDITDRLNPHLISVRVVDKDLATCDLELDDRDGKLPIPPLDARVSVNLGWEGEGGDNVFTGWQTDLEYGVSRSEGGRRMWVHFEGLDMYSKAKEPMENGMGEGAPDGQDQGEQIPVPAWLQKAGQAAGVSVSINPKFGDVTDDNHAQTNESFMNVVQRLARAHGGIYQFSDKGGPHLEFTVPGENAGGGQTGMHMATWGVNLIACRVRPLAARSMWGSGTQKHFSRLDGIWKRVMKGFNFSGPWASMVNYMLPHNAANASQAQNDNSGVGGETSINNHGRITINGEPSVRWNDHIRISGVRPGVDGDYICQDAVEHIYSRQGYVTWCDVVVNQTAGAATNVGTAYANALVPGTISGPDLQKQILQAIEQETAVRQTGEPAGEPIDPGVAASQLPAFSVPPPSQPGPLLPPINIPFM